MSAPPAPEKSGNSLSFHSVMNGELAAVREKRRELVSPKRTGFLHIFILFLCILINSIFFFTMRDYFALFIAASFYLNMFYFIILLIPTNFERGGLSKNEIIRFHAWLRDRGIQSGTSRFTRLIINSFFINSRALSLGIGSIFVIDIIFALISCSLMNLAPGTTIIVIFQCGVIILFYLLVWKTEPFSTEFRNNIEQVRRRLSQENIPPLIVSAIFMTAIILAVFLFLTTVILLPGITVTAFMSQSGLNELGYLVLFVTVLAVSQYFLIRYIHGITSRTMASRILDFQEESLKELAGTPAAGSGGTSDGQDGFGMPAGLPESLLYSVQQRTLLGMFPVYTVDIDFWALMDSTTRAATQNHSNRKKDEDEDR